VNASGTKREIMAVIQSRMKRAKLNILGNPYSFRTVADAFLCFTSNPRRFTRD
jgi:hypothetical protein